MSVGSASQPWGSASDITSAACRCIHSGMGIHALLIHQASQFTLPRCSSCMRVSSGINMQSSSASCHSCAASLLRSHGAVSTSHCLFTDRRGWVSITTCLCDVHTSMHMSRGSKLTAHHTRMISNAKPYAYEGLHASKCGMMLL